MNAERIGADVRVCDDACVDALCSRCLCPLHREVWTPGLPDLVLDRDSIALRCAESNSDHFDDDCKRPYDT
jgi:hypothetical protein